MKVITPSRPRSRIAPAPVDTAPAPVDTAPAPVDTAPAPVDTAPAPVDEGKPEAGATAFDRVQRSARLVSFMAQECRRDLINASRSRGIDRGDKKGMADGYIVSEFLKVVRAEEKEREAAAGSAAEKAECKQAVEDAVALATLFNALNTKGVQGLLFRVLRRLPETI